MNNGIISPIYFFTEIYPYPIQPLINIPEQLTIEIDGKPFGKQRPRVVSRGGFARAYTPIETINYQNKVKSAYINKYGNRRLEGKIEANIGAYFSVPESASKKKKKELIENNVPYTKKPDCDNIAKCVLDALNDIAYDDDSQICRLTVEKRYNEKSKTIVALKEV